MRTRGQHTLVYSGRLLGVMVVFVCTMANAAAQQEINFTSLTTKNGLSSNTVNAILKDRYGLMWFATEDGLNKYDGNTVTVYRNKPNDEHSLPANEILCLHEDKAGNLWIGTSGGSVSSYNRQNDSFINYPSGDRPGLISNNVIRDICSDKQGNIWIANFNGVNIIAPLTKKIARLMADNGQPFSNICNAILADSAGTIWIGTAEGLYAYNPATKLFRRYINILGDSTSIGGNTIGAIETDQLGRIWVGTQAGLSMLQLSGAGFVNYTHHQNNPNTISNNFVHSIAVAEQGKLWIGTERGLTILDSKTGLPTNIFFDYRNVHGLTGEAIRTIYLDNKGTYWLGTTGGGVDKYDQNLNLFNHIPANPFDKTGLNAPVVTAFAEQAGGKIFVGTEGGGVSLFNPGTKQFVHFIMRSKREGADNRITVRSLKLINDNQLLIATLADGLFVLNPVTGSYRQMQYGPTAHDLNSNDITCVTADRAGNWWVGTNGDGINIMNTTGRVIRRFTPVPQQTADVLLPINGFIRDILEDSTGNVWIATHGGGMAKYNPVSHSFTIFNTTNSKLPNDKVQSLLEDHNGNIWAGTFGGGLCIVNKSNGKLLPFTEQDGLPNNTVYKVIEDLKGIIWISSNKGLASIDPLSKKVNNYNYYNGVQRNNFSQGAGLSASNGTIYFGGLEGFNYFQPQFLKRNTNIPAVLITDLKIANQPVTPVKDGIIEEHVSIAKVINLGFKQNFSLSFVGLNYTAPGQNQYAYKLEGFDKDWNYVGSTTVAHYTNLDPGHYVFRVKASNNDGVWSNGSTAINIVVHPPVWRTVYAYVLYALLIAGLVIYLRHKSIEKIKNKFKRNEEQKEALRVHELDQLKIKFLTNLSHEFRTPISLILAPVDNLLVHEAHSGRAAHLQMIKRNGKRLLNLVNQLLDFRKMEEQELKLQPHDGEFVSFTKDVFDSFRDLAERKKISFTFISKLNALPSFFDHDKIERILFNLLSNAFKFTLEGGAITLLLEEVEQKTDNADITRVFISVTDTGIGIPADKKEKIFERFFQHPTTASVLNQGSGIGLSITREFVTMHGGTIDVASEINKGTSFSIYLPLLRAGNDSPVNDYHNSLQETIPAHTEPAPAATVDEETKMPVVLLVEDNDDFRFYLKENLRLHYTVYEAANGKEGWQRALARHPELIVSDISMPYMDGIELCKKLKADKRTNHIPVILLTALTGESDQLKGLQTGANDYISKPFNFELLHSKIRNLLLLQNTFKKTYTKKIDVNLAASGMQNDDEKLLANLILYLEQNLSDNQVSVEALSRHLGMSRSTLYHKLFQLTGQTPVEYIRSFKLDKAADLILHSDMNVAQIAYSVGFATPKYFAKTFKARFNLLPSEYISKMRKTPEPKL